MLACVRAYVHACVGKKKKNESNIKVHYTVCCDDAAPKINLII